MRMRWLPGICHFDDEQNEEEKSHFFDDERFLTLQKPQDSK
jgi:hypothetical protein